MSKRNGAQYAELLELSERQSIPFDVLCARYERGHRGNELLGRMRPLTAEWMTTEEATRCLCIGKSALWSADLSLVTRKPRSRASKRGRGFGGMLYLRSDIEELARIRKATHVGLNIALRILSAKREGRL